MKVVHLCLGCFYIDNSTYQENLLSKYHQSVGYDVEIIAPPINQRDGKFVIENEYKVYQNEHGIQVTRLPYKELVRIARKLCRYQGLYNAIEKAKPDILYIHGLQSVGATEVVKYLQKNPNVKVYVDNHVDFMNSAKNVLSREILHKRLWRHNAKILNPYVKKFYGVLPARVDFLIDIYKLPKEKVELLVLGVDDDLLQEVEKSNARQRLRENLNVKSETTLVITGGKINSDRPETLQLMEAVNKANRNDIQMIVFGNVAEEYKSRFDELCESHSIQFIGWLNAKQIYEYFQAADLIAFPGLHSVLWEQAVGSGKACIFRKMDGFTHIDIGGNCTFFSGLDSEAMKEDIIKIVDTGQIDKMTEIAEEKGKKYFSYRDIAKRCLND